MRILVVSATKAEIGPFVARLPCTPEDTGIRRCKWSGHEVDVLVTGVGMVATAAWLSRALVRQNYDRAFNFGLCGSFDPGLPPGTVVHVVHDRIAELGAEDDDEFLTLEELELGGPNEVSFRLAAGDLSSGNAALEQLPHVTGITVNTVHGNERSIAGVVDRFSPQVESMEGAAFMYTCAIHRVRHYQVRAVSNVVEKRNRSAWKITEAIEKLGDAARDIIEHE